MRTILVAALTSAVASAGATIMPSPAAALTWTEITRCVSAFSENPRGSACMAAIQSFRCANRDSTYESDVQIGACTAASEGASWSPEDLSEIFIDRGTAYHADNHQDEAIADYSEAIRIYPQAAVAFYDRGLIYHDKGDLDRAIADFNAALRLGRRGDGAFSAFYTYYDRAGAYRQRGKFDRAIADYDEAYRLTTDDRASINRGLTYLAKGDFEHALADYTQAINDDDPRTYLYPGILRLYTGQLPEALSNLGDAWTGGDDPDDAYAALWLDIARERSHLPSKLAQMAKTIAIDKWPAPVIHLYLGELTEDATLTAAENPDPNTKTAHVCEANFFAGELALRRNATDKAETLLRRATPTGCGILIAWAADTELKSLGAPPSNDYLGRPSGALDDAGGFKRLPIMKYPPPMPAVPAQQHAPARTIVL